MICPFSLQFLISQVVHNRPMKITRDEHDVFDVPFADEFEQFGSLGCITLETVFGIDDTKVLNRLRNDDKFPYDPIPLAVKQIVLEAIHLCPPQHRTIRSERTGQEGLDFIRVEWIADRRQRRIAKRPGIQNKNNGIASVGSLPIELGFSVREYIVRRVP